MKSVALGAALLFYSSLGLTAAVQVPEGCAGKILPCLIRTEERSFRFKHENVEALMPADSILKITERGGQTNFEILAGHVALTEVQKSEKTYTLNGVIVDSDKIFAARFADKLEILSLNTFSIGRYDTPKGAAFPTLVSSEFVNKKDLAQFTRFFFSDVASYRGFLTGIEQAWKAEFVRQNVSQTKALRRALASEQKREADILNKKIRLENELKKVRSDFFYRTFYR